MVMGNGGTGAKAKTRGEGCMCSREDKDEEKKGSSLMDEGIAGDNETEGRVQ